MTGIVEQEPGQEPGLYSRGQGQNLENKDSLTLLSRTKTRPGLIEQGSGQGPGQGPCL